MLNKGGRVRVSRDALPHVEGMMGMVLTISERIDVFDWYETKEGFTVNEHGVKVV